MSLTTIFSVPRNDEDLASWAFSHMAHHRDINRVVQEQFATRIDEFALDPFDPENMDGWLALHQQMHNQQNAAMGISGYNLSEVDWQDENSRSEWIWQNADEHFRANQILGI